ncbi:hypothetical protein D7M11_35645 [Paenibacillus ginsengarvi]|uniref:Uncharacterized protein n=2 Tax=Paenibacillus ginsengarvi TaxID=400777 RepID=A0A3B0AKS9_9BACL|nr:hypothetical protein D7M11_35645 [Paenibacillus ginsengarvi]
MNDNVFVTTFVFVGIVMLFYGFLKKKQINPKINSMASLTFDGYKGDQVTQMYFHESTIGDRMYGYVLYDRPNGVTRARMDRSQDGSVGVKLSDSKGQERIRLVIDANDVPILEFLNEKGKVVYSLPPKQQD